MGGSFEADGPMETSPEEVAELRAQAEKAAENWDKYVRLNADFENFKKRAARERQEAIRYANEGLLEKLIPILDNFEMAMQAANAPQGTAGQAKGSQGQAASAPAQGGAADALKQGVNMIASQLKSALNEAGLEEIDATGQVFNPNLHEAVSQQESKDVPEGRVLQQLRKGYKLRDRLVRPATVIVSKKAGA
jgi:molecular chaperone GrpE